MDFGKVKIPVIALAIGAVIKLILNIVLISNPNINIYGATIGSIACQCIAFIICWVALNKYIKMDIKFKKNILKPTVSAAIMGGIAYGVYYLIHHVMENIHIAYHAAFWTNAIPTLIAMIVGVVVYVLAIFISKCLSKEEIHMMPFGSKIYGVLVKMKLYKEI